MYALDEHWVLRRYRRRIVPDEEVAIIQHVRVNAFPTRVARAIGPGDAALHLDLHPENVLMGTRGPQVIDWANARRGHWADDVAQTVVILAGALVPGPIAAVVPVFVDAFLESFDRGEVWAHLDATIARRVADPNLNELARDAARAVRIDR